MHLRYMDEASFMAHSASRQFLDGYAVVMDPSLHYTVPQTLRVGTPSQNMIDTILEPVLKEQVVDSAGAKIFQTPPPPPHVPALLSFDMPQPPQSSPDAATTSCQHAIQSLPPALVSACTTCAAFPHPFRAHCIRVLLIFSSLPMAHALAGLHTIGLQRGELYVQAGDDHALKLARAALQEASLTCICALGGDQAGHIMHSLSSELRPSE